MLESVRGMWQVLGEQQEVINPEKYRGSLETAVFECVLEE